MLVFVSVNRSNELKFSQACKLNKLEFLIIEKVSEMFYYSEIIKKAFIVIDWENLYFSNIFYELKLNSKILNNSLIISKNHILDFSNVDSLNDAITIAKFQLYKNNENYEEDNYKLECAAEDVLKRYGFKSSYEGYKYLKSICVNQLRNNNVKFKYKDALNEVSCFYGIDNILSIERNLRYIVQINSNIEVVNTKGSFNKVHVKEVILFLISKIEEFMTISPII